MSYDLAEIRAKDFDLLLEELELYVEDEENEESFHFDKSHSYRIDGRAWEHGTVIYGMMKKDAGKESGVITKSKLVPLRDAGEFKEHVIKVGHRMYEESAPSYGTRGKKNKKKRGKLSCFRVALCVVLLKEKVPVTKVTSKGGSSGRETNVDGSLIHSSIGRKRRRTQPYVFPARKLCVMLHAPLQTSVKKSRGMTESTKTTGVQKGKTVVDLIYDMERWCNKPNVADADADADVDADADADDLSSTSNITNVSYFLS